MTTAARIVVDASVAVKWYVPETGSSEASALLDGNAQRLAPDLLAAELANTIWKKVRRGELDDSADGVGEVLECGSADDKIEGLARERHVGGVAVPEIDADPCLPSIFTRYADEGPADVQAGNLEGA